MLSQAQPLPLGLNPVLLVADPPADHLTLISLVFIAPSGVHLTLADGTSCQMDEIRHQVLRPQQGYATVITSVRRPGVRHRDHLGAAAAGRADPALSCRLRL